MMDKIGRVLCVDDEPNILRSLQWLLTKKFDVSIASSGQDALALVKENDFDVIISDQRMPGITGAEFLREVRKISPRSMRMLLTGYSDMQAILRSINEGEIYRFIRKPWEIKLLVELTEQACKIAKSKPAPDEDESKPLTNTDSEAILLLDDDTIIRAELSSVTGDTIEVAHTEDLAEAVAILSEQKIGVIVSNTSVAGRDVTGLLKLIKQSMPDIVCVIISDKTDVEAMIDLINQGQVYRFIPKPMKHGYIKLVITSALRKRHQLINDPGFARRHSVEIMDGEKSRQLMAEIKELAAQGQLRAKTDDVAKNQFSQRVKGGLRRFFGSG